MAVDSDPGLERKRKALQDQRHLETYNRIHCLKDMLSSQYSTLLKEKVQRQREEMKFHNPDNSRCREGHNYQKFVSIQRVTRSTLTHDDAYLRFLPKTRHYLVLELQKQLVRLGYLQSRKEQEVFRVWNEQQRSTYQLEKQLKALEHSSPDVTLEGLLKQMSGSLPKLQITPDDSTAQHRPMTVSLRGGEGGVSAFQLQGKQTWGRDETELMVPEVFTQELKVPKLFALRSIFLEEVNSNMLNISLTNHKSPINLKTIDRTHKVRLMHNLTLSHMADSQRIMAKTGLSLQCTDGFSIKEFMEPECSHNVQSQKSRCPTEPDLKHLSEKRSAEIPEAFPNTPFSASLQSSGKSIGESPSSTAGDSHSSYTDVPLCIADVCASHTVEVENRNIKMWTNYV